MCRRTDFDGVWTCFLLLLCTANSTYPLPPHRATLLLLLCLVYQQLCIIFSFFTCLKKWWNVLFYVIWCSCWTHYSFYMTFTTAECLKKSEKESWTITPANNSFIHGVPAQTLGTPELSVKHTDKLDSAEVLCQSRLSDKQYRDGCIFLSRGGVIEMSVYVVMCSFHPTGVYLA